MTKLDTTLERLQIDLDLDSGLERMVLLSACSVTPATDTLIQEETTLYRLHLVIEAQYVNSVRLSRRIREIHLFPFFCFLLWGVALSSPWHQSMVLPLGALCYPYYKQQSLLDAQLKLMQQKQRPSRDMRRTTSRECNKGMLQHWTLCIIVL